MDNNLYKKISRDKFLSFKATKNTWCLQLDLLTLMNGAGLASNVYVMDINPKAKDIVVPVTEIMYPYDEEYMTPGNEISFYSCYNFINYTFSDTYTIGLQSKVIDNYKIDGRSMTNLQKTLMQLTK